MERKRWDEVCTRPAQPSVPHILHIVRTCVERETLGRFICKQMGIYGQWRHNTAKVGPTEMQKKETTKVRKTRFTAVRWNALGSKKGLDDHSYRIECAADFQVFLSLRDVLSVHVELSSARNRFLHLNVFISADDAQFAIVASVQDSATVLDSQAANKKKRTFHLIVVWCYLIDFGVWIECSRITFT